MTKECSQLSGWNAVKCIWEQYSALWIVPSFIFGFIIGFVVPVNNEFFESMKPEIVGIGLTITGIYALDQWRQQKAEELRLKEELLWQVKSQSNAMAKSAVDRLRY